jgi:hypothetical protein
MSFTDNASIGPDISGTKPKKNLTIQDAIIAIAVYAGQLKPYDCEVGIKKIQSLAQKNPLFSEDSESTRSRINKFANSMNAGKAKEFVNLAAASLTLKLKKIAFEWAVELSLDEECSLGKRQNLLEDLRILLAIDNQIANRIVSDIITKKK